MKLLECDETFYWFLTLKADDPLTDEQAEIQRAMGIDPVEATLNLWPCRKCGAMVHGGLRSQHRQFHNALEQSS